MAARYEITKKYARAYAAAPKKGKSEILDQVVEITGVESGPRPPTAHRPAETGPGPGGRDGRGHRPTHDQATEVLLRRDQGAPTGLGHRRAELREVPRGRDDRLAGGDGSRRLTGARPRPLQPRGADGVGVDVAGHDRPLPRPHQSHRSDPRQEHHQTRQSAA